METKETPLWLDLRKEYIDDNFEKLLPYLKRNSIGKHDDFYPTTISLLKERVQELVSNIGAEPIYSPQKRESNVFSIRLLASYLLVDDNSDTAFYVFLALFKLLLQNSKEEMGKNIMCLVNKRLKNTKCERLGYNWEDIEDYKEEIFLYKLTENMTFSQEVKNDRFFFGHGSAAITKNGMFLMDGNEDKVNDILKSGAISLDTQIGCAIKTPKGEKLKQQEKEDLDKIELFLKDFISSSRQIKPKAKEKRLLNYSTGDEAVVRVIKKEKSTLYLETTDKRYEKVQGILKFQYANVFYYDVPLFLKYLNIGDLIKATINFNGTKDGEFYITDQFTSFCIEDCREHIGFEETLAVLYRENKSTYAWISEDGIPIYSRKDPLFKIGDFAILQITNYGKGSNYGIIESEIIKGVNDTFDKDEVMSLCIEDFAKATPDIIYKEEKTINTFDPAALRILSAIFFSYQQTLKRPIERITLLANARIMEEILTSQQQASFIKFASDYLRMLVKFAREENIKDVLLTPDSSYADEPTVKTRLKVFELLKEYGKKDNSEILADCISEYETTNPMLSRLARLIQTSNTLDGVLSNSAMNIIKREIIKTLSIETENDADLDDGSNRFLGVESSTVEFKTSMIFPADNNMQPDEKRQTNNVFRAICAFLNSTIGGTVYIGVNDMGYVCGIKNDFNFLKCQTTDSYTRFIQDKIIGSFGLDVMTYIHIEPIFDEEVVAIKVEPHPYKIIELNQVAYIRVNNESREMTDAVKHDVLQKKVVNKKNDAAKLVQLQYAISEQRCAIFKNYSSSHSGNISDRIVEPYQIYPSDGIVICLDHKDNKCKVFSLSRINYVEVLDKPWNYKGNHRKISVDAFHMTGEKPIKILWKMDLFAKNLLVEEYPSAKKDISPNKENENEWYFETVVYQITGIARFYIGLVEHITLLNAPELAKYIREYKNKIPS